jgi:hypothetical protein
VKNSPTNTAVSFSSEVTQELFHGRWVQKARLKNSLAPHNHQVVAEAEV